MRSSKDRIAWSSSLLSKRPKKPKETDWFKRILDGLVADSHNLSDEVKSRIHMAAIVVAKAIGGGWSSFRLAFAVVRATVLCPQAVGESLIKLFSLCYLKPGTDRPQLDPRGDLIIAVEKQYGPLKEGQKERGYVVTTQRGSRLMPTSEVRAMGVTARHPMLLSTEQVQELRALMFAAKWGEAEGYFEKSWTVRDDGSLEVGLHPKGSSREDGLEDVTLYQHHVDKADDLKRERWIAVLEQKRSARKNDYYAFGQLERPWHLGQAFRAPTKGGVGLVEAWYESTFDMHDKQDRADDSDCHEGYSGLVPLGSPTMVENQLQTRRVRARMGWEVRAYQLKGGDMHRISSDKKVLCSDGRIWTPEDENGNPEQDFFADPRQVLTWQDKETKRWIRIQRWNKMVMQKDMLEFKVPKGSNELGYELYDHVRGRDITSAEAISLLHDKSVIVLRSPTFRRELEGMFLSAVEEAAYTKVEFFHKDRGFGSPSHPVVKEVFDYEGNLVLEKATCKRCEEKWGAVKDAVKATWVEQSHAYVCNSCGSEVWKVGLRVYVDAKYFPFVIKRDKRVTHYSAEFFGPWVREVLRQTGEARAKKLLAETKAQSE